MLRKFKNIHVGETCVVMGNGPSLKSCPRELLSSYPTFGSNKIFLLPHVPTYYTAIDQDMLHDCTEVLTKGYVSFESDDYIEHDFMEFKPKEVFVPKGFPIPGSNQMNLSIEYGFSHEISENVVMGGTVTYAMLQIAYYMGFETVLLVGVDHKYPKASVGGKPGSKFLADNNDIDHFHPQYFKEGRIYNRPELDATTKMYLMADHVFTSSGRKILNLTPGSALDVIEKQDYREWL